MFKKIFQRTAVILMLSVGLLVAAETFGFSGGVTGHLWFGKVWARWNSHPKTNNNVVIYACGKTTSKSYASNRSSAYTEVNRIPSGNRAYWHYY